MNNSELYHSWGNFPKKIQIPYLLSWQGSTWPNHNTVYLPFGKGRSYGDSCLNSTGVLLVTTKLNRFIAFDPKLGSIECEAGVTLEDILNLVVPQGWFLPVTPGTKFVTIGGAIANDVHGKNHHKQGTFGCHVQSFVLKRSNGEILTCSATENPAYFNATIGGLGLTGLILSAKISLIKINNPYLWVEKIKFSGIDEFFELSQKFMDDEYTVAWVDCLAKGKNLGRGIFMRGKHLTTNVPVKKQVLYKSKQLPFNMPAALLNSCSIKAFNNLYYHRQYHKTSATIMHYEPFFYPLDSMQHWNRLYGTRGFLQYQCVIPTIHQEQIKSLLQDISAANLGSFLSVLKLFGKPQSPGLLSFPRPGVTLALDFPNTGKPLFNLLNKLDEKVMALGGAVYPAKDARMSSAAFKTFFPNAAEFAKYIDPRFSSDFWRRVNNKE